MPIKTHIESTSIKGFLNQVLGVYLQLGQKNIQGIVRERIDFLRELISEKGVENRTIKLEDQKRLFEIIIDALILSAASYSFEKLAVKDFQLLGQFNELKNISKSQQKDWLMQLMIQAWLHYKGIAPLHDLKKDVLTSVCEYKFQDDSQDHLVECKRLNAGSSENKDTVDLIVNKIFEKVSKKQLKKTEEKFGINAIKAMYVDVSEYARSLNRIENDHYKLEVLGLEEEFICRLGEEIKKYIKINTKDSSLNNLTVCWNETYFLDGLPRALNVKSKRFGVESKYIFDGLSLELLPMEGKNSLFSEIRFRTNVPNDYVDWIITTMNSLTDPQSFYSISSVETES